MKMIIIIHFIMIWSNVSLEVQLKTKINIRKCGKIIMLKLPMVIIIKIIMVMLVMKELTIHGDILLILIITIIIIILMELDMVAMDMVDMAMEAMVWDIMQRVKMKIAGTVA